MDERTKNFFKEVDKYISKVIYDDELMKINIKYMYRFSNHEWYNIAAILLQNSEADTVMSVSAFRRLSNDNLICPRLGKKAYRVAVPKNDKNGKLIFKLVPVFDVTDLNKTIVIDNMIPLRLTVEKHGGAGGILSLLNKYTSLEKLINITIENNYHEYLTKKEMEECRDVIKNCIMFSLGRVFNIDPNIKMVFKKTDNAVGLYSYVKYLIEIFPEELNRLIGDLKSRMLCEEREKKLEHILNRNIKQRVIDAKSKIINELSDIENIPPPEDDCLIYEGEYDL